MRIGILGSGLMGGKLGTIFAKAGHDVVFSYARSQRKLNRLARQAGRRAVAGTPREAAEDADVLLLAVHWSRVNDVLKQAGDLSGKVLVTCSLPMNARDTALVIAHTSSGAEALAKKYETGQGRLGLRHHPERSVCSMSSTPSAEHAAVRACSSVATTTMRRTSWRS